MKSKPLLSAKYAKHEDELDWDTEVSFSTILDKSDDKINIRLWDHMEEEWVTVRSYNSHTYTVTVQDDKGTSWSENWDSNYWLHCDLRSKTMIPSHYSPVLPLSERTDLFMQIARNVGVPAWMVLNNPASKKLVVKDGNDR